VVTIRRVRVIEQVRVFVDERGRFGSVLSIVLDSADLADDVCGSIARQAATSETVFIDDAEAGNVRIFTPAGRIPFAGYPLVGAGWFLHRHGAPVGTLTTDTASVTVVVEEDECSIVAPAGRGNPWKLVECATPADVLAADSGGPGRHDYLWAWEDPDLGTVRARAFASASGTVEDEATGSAAIELCAALGRALTIRQGRGSLIRVTPVAAGIRLSGRVVAVEVG